MAEKRRIYREEFNRILLSIIEISPAEREFLKEAFSGDLVDGLTEWELKQKIQSLKFNQDDPINQWDAEKVRSKLLEKMSK